MVSITAAGQRLRRVFVQVIDQGDQLTEPPAYGSWLLGQVLENQRSRRIRIQVILTSVIVFANLVGIGVVLLIAIVAIPAPNVFTDAPWWVTFVVAPAYIVVALVLGTYWITRRTVQTLRWALEERPPSHADARSTFRVPRQVALATATLWGVGAMASTILYGLANPLFIPRFLFTVSICGAGLRRC